MIKTLKPIIIRLLYLLIIGIVIGLLHRQQWWVMVILIVALSLSVRRTWRQALAGEGVHIRLYLVGVAITMLLGVLAELWGTYFGHWHYYGLPTWQLIPVWLPFAWGCAYSFLYHIERRLLSLVPSRLVVLLVVSLVVPTLGEIIPVNMMVWTYAWPYQLLGIPVYAMGLLMILHGGIFALLMGGARMFRCHDIVYGGSGK